MSLTLPLRPQQHYVFRRVGIAILLFLMTSHFAHAQAVAFNNGEFLTLPQCVDYALKNQPLLRIARLNLRIANTDNAINLSGWLPQVSVSANFTHYIQQPQTIFGDSTGKPQSVRTGVQNNLTPTLNVTQAIFSPSLLYYATGAPLFTKLSKQAIDSTNINVVSNVSKAFYQLLLTVEKIEVLKEDTIRLNKNMTDAYYKWQSGVVDETDYDEARISLINSRVALYQSVENVRPQYAVLKQYMGFPPQKDFNISFDTLQMKQDILLDTTEQLKYENRIEFQQLQTAKAIQKNLILYNYLTFLPTVNALYTYNYVFQNNSLPDLFGQPYPNMLVGASITLPIFTGLSRVENVHKSKLQAQVLNWREESLRSIIYTDYTTALANYKYNLNNLYALSENVDLARRAYGIVDLQYRQGIVAYLNVITAESNLINSQIGYINALSSVLSAKIDLKKAMGNITY